MALPPLGKGGKRDAPLGKRGKFVNGETAMDKQLRKHNTELTPRARALRKNMTEQERHLWYAFLKDYPVRILRQKVIDDFIVDFYCHDARIAIEIDGSQHYTDSGLEHDKIRTEKIADRGITVIRIPNNEVNTHFASVCEYIDNEIKKALASLA